MPDITMCKGKEGESLCNWCYRKLSSPTPFWQSHFAEVPLRVRDGCVECEYYWEILKQDTGGSHEMRMVGS